MQKLFVVCVNGFPRSGKDTFVQSFMKEAPRDMLVRHVSTVDNAKAALQTLGWDRRGKTPEVREALDTLKQMSNRLFNGSVEYIKHHVQDMKQQDYRIGVLFVDSREPEELELFNQLFGSIAVLVSRPNGEIKTLSNPADKNVLMYQYDHFVDNSGTLENLQQEAKTFLWRRIYNGSGPDNAYTTAVGIRRP